MIQFFSLYKTRNTINEIVVKEVLSTSEKELIKLFCTCDTLKFVANGNNGGEYQFTYTGNSKEFRYKCPYPLKNIRLPKPKR